MKQIKENIKSEILEKSSEYRDYTAKVLSDQIKVPGFSGREEEVCKLIKKQCEEAGFDEVYIDGLGSVVGRIGKGKKILAFDAHIDTVGIGDIKQWKRNPHSGDIDEKHVYGLGTADQRGGASAMITSGRILKEMAYDGDFTIYYTFTVMEEDCDGLAWIYLIEKEGIKPDFIVSSEPSACELYRGQRGRMEIEILLKGISSHGSMPEGGDSAAYKAAKVALAMDQLNKDLQPDEDNFLGKGSLTVSHMETSAPSQCSVPDAAKLYLDRRMTWGEDADFCINQVKESIKKTLGEDADKVYMPYYDKKGYKGIEFGQELFFPTWKFPVDHQIVKGAQRAYKELFGKEIEPGPCSYSTNAVSFAGRYNIPSIILGPGDVGVCHKPNEFTRINDLEKCTAFYTMLPYILGN